MVIKSGTLDNWRNYFRTSDSDILDIIEHAIMVAFYDCPQELRLRRDRIAQKLYSCKLSRCIGCDRVELGVPGDDEDKGCRSEFDRDGCQFEAGGSKESNVNSGRDDQAERTMKQTSIYSYGEAEALTDEIEEESQIVGEVLRIKDILDNSQDESDSVLFDSMRRLQLMALSVDTLKTTEIGKSVNGLRKHGLKQIRHLARTLIEVWKAMVDEWVNSTAAVAATEGTPESVNPSVVDEEEGLPFPPLDEAAFFVTQPTSFELSKFFDGMDDDGNPQSGGEFNKNRRNGRKPSMETQNFTKQKHQVPRESYVPTKDKKDQEMKKQTAIVKPHKPSNTESGPRIPARMNVEQTVNNETKIEQKWTKTTIQKKPLAGQQDKIKCLDDATRLEAAKRKLHDRYQQLENAKRQRTIQVVELGDLPKQGLCQRNVLVKPGNHDRQRLGSRF